MVKNNLRSGSIITCLTAPGACNYAISFLLSRSQILILLLAVVMRKLEWTAIDKTPLAWASIFHMQSHRFITSTSASFCYTTSSSADTLFTFFSLSMFSIIPSSSSINCLFDACFYNFFYCFMKLDSSLSCLPIFLSFETKFLIFVYLSWTTSHFLLVF